jgi:hypothetical protein
VQQQNAPHFRDSEEIGLHRMSGADYQFGRYPIEVCTFIGHHAVGPSHHGPIALHSDDQVGSYARCNWNGRQCGKWTNLSVATGMGRAITIPKASLAVSMPQCRTPKRPRAPQLNGNGRDAASCRSP